MIWILSLIVIFVLFFLEHHHGKCNPMEWCIVQQKALPRMGRVLGMDDGPGFHVAYSRICNSPAVENSWKPQRSE